MIAGREAGIRGYEDAIQRLRDETAELMGSLDDLKQGAIDIHGQVEETRIERSALQAKLSESEGGVGAKRSQLDKAREFKGKLEVAATEATMRRQNVYDHLSQEYGLDAQAVLREPDRTGRAANRRRTTSSKTASTRSPRRSPPSAP